MTDIPPVRAEFPGPTPHICVRSVAAAVPFYTAAFGADELYRNTGDDGRVWHCEVLIAGGRMLLVDEFPDMGVVAPPTLGGTTVTLHLYIEDTDATYARALEAGATAVMEPSDAFWGERYAQVVDPFGHRWSLSSGKEDLSGAEQTSRGADWRDAHGDPSSPGEVPGTMVTNDS